MMTEEPTKMSNKFSEKFVTMRRKPVTDETSRKPVTDDNVTEDTHCAYQNNSDDCGLYAIANAIAEVFGTDPTMQEYDTELMRGHLLHCMEQNEMSPFPARSRKSSFANGVRYWAYIKVFCSCQTP